jgi:ribosomal protein S18 acetylase RimI-like enzyme
MAVTIFSGLHPHLKADAARLYWEAFGGKLGKVLGPDAPAIAFFERVIRTDHCLAALDETGALIGIAGYKTTSGSFAGGSWDDLIAVYGTFGGRWRGSILWALNREVARRGYRSIRLDVVDMNWRAKALYERQGFVATQTERLGPLRHVFGFATSTTMVRPLTAREKG